MKSSNLKVYRLLMIILISMGIALATPHPSAAFSAAGTWADSVETEAPEAPATGAAAIKVKAITVNLAKPPDSFEENVYIVYDDHSKDAVIVDPGKRDARIEAFIKEEGLKVRQILNTHGHGDHIGGNKHYADLYKVQITAPEGDKPLYGRNGGINRAHNWFSTDTTLKYGTLTFKAIHTPGHSPGSSCFHIGNHLTAGDTLFEGSIGRTFGRTDKEEMELERQEIDSIKNKLLILPADTLVYPGHGGETTIGKEAKTNQFLVED